MGGNLQVKKKKGVRHNNLGNDVNGKVIPYRRVGRKE